MESVDRIEAVLDQEVRPYLRMHNGNVTLLGIHNGIITVSLSGACAGCPSADLDTREYIEKVLRKDIPGIKAVRIEHPVSSEMIDFARKILNHEITDV